MCATAPWQLDRRSGDLNLSPYPLAARMAVNGNPVHTGGRSGPVSLPEGDLGTPASVLPGWVLHALCADHALDEENLHRRASVLHDSRSKVGHASPMAHAKPLAAG